MTLASRKICDKESDMPMKNASHEERMKALASLSDEALYERFWGLVDELVSPLVELAQTHTTPSIERSVVMRMGFDSLQARAFVERCIQEGVIGRGAGAILVNYARQKGASYQQAFELLTALKDWQQPL